MEPDIAMGTRPDGSAWVVGVSFGHDVRIDGYGEIYDGRKKITADAARQRANALLAAAEWIESDKTATLEASA